MRPKLRPKLRIDRRDRVGLVVALLVAAICVRLGVWQLHRLHERRQRNALLLAARPAPTLHVDGALPAAPARARRLVARGVYDYAHERLWHGRSYEGVPGVDLVTPLRLAGGAAVLVDRGWAPSPDAFHVDQPAYRERDSAVVLGLGMLAPRARGDVDPAALRDSLPYRLLQFVIQELPPATAPYRPLAPGLIRWPTPELSDGPHLSYAIQWFSFAVIIGVGSLALDGIRSEEHTSELQSQSNLVCRLLLEKKKKKMYKNRTNRTKSTKSSPLNNTILRVRCVVRCVVLLSRLRSQIYVLSHTTSMQLHDAMS